MNARVSRTPERRAGADDLHAFPTAGPAGSTVTIGMFVMELATDCGVTRHDRTAAVGVMDRTKGAVMAGTEPGCWSPPASCRLDQALESVADRVPQATDLAARADHHGDGRNGNQGREQPVFDEVLT